MAALSSHGLVYLPFARSSLTRRRSTSARRLAPAMRCSSKGRLSSETSSFQATLLRSPHFPTVRTGDNLGFFVGREDDLPTPAPQAAQNLALLDSDAPHVPQNGIAPSLAGRSPQPISLSSASERGQTTTLGGKRLSEVRRPAGRAEPRRRTPLRAPYRSSLIASQTGAPGSHRRSLSRNDGGPASMALIFLLIRGMR